MKDIWTINFWKVIVRIIFLSFEFLFFVVMFFVKIFAVIPFDDIANKLFVDMETVKWITLGFPRLICAGSLKLHVNLLQPEENNKVFYGWPEYEKYKITTHIGVGYCFLPLVPAFVSAFWFNLYDEYDIGFYYVLLLGISIISIISLYLSKFEVKRILQELP
jgi:hypothetical protein